MSEAKAALTAVKAVVGTIAAVTAILSVVNASVIVALNTLGVVGLGGLVIGGMTWGSGSDANRLVQIRNTAWAVAVTTVIAATAFTLGRPLDENERQAGLLTVIGAAFVLGVLTLGVLAYGEIQAGKAEPTKRCPACAETILAAAKKCKHCGEELPEPQSP